MNDEDERIKYADFGAYHAKPRWLIVVIAVAIIIMALLWGR